MQRTENFNDDEFKCRCCGMLRITPQWIRFIEKLQEARTRAKIPFVITSGARCPAHNQAVGGVTNSPHLTTRKNLASDIETKTVHFRFVILEALLFVGFTRIGIKEECLHVDEDPNKVPEVAWLY
jgi:hypothetical protein